MRKVFLDGISSNMVSLLQTRKYSAINVVDPTTIGYYVLKYAYDTVTLQEDIKTYGQLGQ